MKRPSTVCRELSDTAGRAMQPVGSKACQAFTDTVMLADPSECAELTGRKQELMQVQALALGLGLLQRGIVHGQWAWPAGKPRRGRLTFWTCAQGTCRVPPKRPLL